ncbi:biopolymer transport protein TolR [Sphaerotilus sulfidivorans]|jgi:biopolymer transport protein TolR|uniref:Biopolymer transport protein TolR n=2 Tax=Sphaerotilus TaxID=34102 RepID=A0A5C1Q0D0_9BURK|nr:MULTISPECIES: ExbD/TolR family protein [Sphaerotilus]KDB52361.1 biopolymer transport protein ExbD/TolR [Sphaerotilus natans subsp. natans DSM 6575]MCK6400717.1 ExbD/TolR family protein [Sphaerotilus sulfidivorans]NZD45622.1 ExbD/TolR family protein [Sphaerotilus sulfidivorans]QEN00439.1 ExbD/TolR family protein [Sphaerotilus sulfidivorans]SIR73032.1 Cell division and transport-associated protein TolR [Sphaerotilus natans]
MPAMQSRSGSGRRRTINEINMVPFIDVMLVLLIIFMVSAPLMTPGVVDLPTIGQAQRQPDRVIEVIVDADGQLRLKVDGRTPAGSDPDERVAMGRLAARVKALAEGAAQVPVIIAADKGVRYELVVKVMDTLQRAGVARVGLAVRTTGG